MKKLRRGAALVLSAALALMWLPLRSSATLADDQESEWLGEVCEIYESGITREAHPDNFKYLRARLGANNPGDPGGKSYGAYQMASRAGTPKIFFEWCQQHGNETYRLMGDRLSTAYYTGGPGCGEIFDGAWSALADEYPELFWQAQHDFAIETFYRSTVNWVEANVPGFKIENYSIALRNTLFSRAIQHGTGGVRNVVTRAFTALGGFANQPETELIGAIYAESGGLRDPREGDQYIMSNSDAKKYGIDGKVMKYFSGSAASIQTHVYARLRINEPVLIQSLLQKLAYNDLTTYTVDQGIYQLLPMANTALALNDTLTLTAAEKTSSLRFKLTYYASGYYILTHVDSGLRLTDTGSAVTLAAPVVGDDQFWAIAPFNDGFSLKNRATGRYLNVTALSAGGKAAGTEAAGQWQLAVADSDWTLIGASGAYPSLESNLIVGNTSFVMRGMLTSTSPITNVTVSVKNDAGQDAFAPVSATPNVNYYDLNAMDSRLPFSKMGVGYYTMTITAENQRGDPYQLTSDFAILAPPCTVTFDACGGVCDTEKRYMEAGSIYGTLPVPSLAGYLFKGWFTLAEGGEQVLDTDFVPAGESTLFAHYEKAYTYRFVNFDGSVIVSGQLAEGAVIPLPSTVPSRRVEVGTYYLFEGWEGFTEGMTISGDVTFTALYTPCAVEDALPEMQSDTYAIADGFMRRVAMGTTVSELTSHILPVGFVTVQKDGAAVDANAPMATGMTVTYAIESDPIQTLTVVVTGDINGDGEVDGIDLNRIVAHMLNKTPLTGSTQIAGDINGDGEVDGIDLNRIVAYMLGKMDIAPN